jgi:hypothetical protein
VTVTKEDYPQARPLRTDRIRNIERPFGWIPMRILSSGLLAQLSTPAKLLYFVLCLVSDRNGLSFYSDYRLSVLLKLSKQHLQAARAELRRIDLLAYDEGLYQLMSLPTLVDPGPTTERPIQGIGEALGRLGIEGNHGHS